MSPLFSDDVLDNIRQRFDIVDIVGKYVTLRKSGRNFLGLCPFHSEKTPSFSVSSEKQIFHCFGCGVGGDVIRFMMEIESLNFQEAVTQLANDGGINLPDANKYQFQFDPKEKQKNEIIQIYELTAKFYHYLLLETGHGKKAYNYLLKRGFSGDIIETFNIGYSPTARDTLKNFLKKRGFNEDVIEKAGLIINTDDNSYDRFRNRIMFPIIDSRGRTIAFGGRVMDDSQPKYLNSPETIIFNKSKILYNFFLAKKEIRKKRQAILLEGYIDTISLWRAEIYYGVATLGTSLSDEQAKMLSRETDEIIICYDSDSAGQQATFRAIDVLQKTGSGVKILELPDGLDPDDYINKFGSESFKKHLQTSTKTGTAFKLHFLRKKHDLNDENDKMNYLRSALGVISDLQHAIEREHYLKGLSDDFKISLDSLKNDFKQIYYERRKKKEKSRDNLTGKWNNIINNGNHVGVSKKLFPAYYNAEKNLISLMLRNKKISEKVQENIGSDFHVEDFAVLAAYIYSYYGKGYDSDIARLISGIDDQKYVKLATELAMLEINETASDKELNDYILQVKNYNLDLEIKRKKEEQIKAERNKDFVSSAEIGLEIIKLRNQIKNNGEGN